MAELENQIVKMIGSALKKENILKDDNFFDNGGTSIKALMLLNKINQTFNTNIIISELANNFTATEIVKIIENRTTSGKKNDFLHIKEFNQITKGKKNLVFLHDVSGYTDGYFNLIDSLNTKYNLFGINAYLNEYKYPKKDNVSKMADIYIDEILNKEIASPLTILGWSDGGVIGFEITDKLEKRGVRIDNLIMFDTPFPNAYVDFSIETEKMFINKIISAEKLEINIDNFNSLEALWDYLYETADQINSDRALSIIKKEFPYLFQYIPHLASSNLKKALNEINMSRTISLAASKYTVNKKINNHISYFSPTEGIRNSSEEWSDYCEKYTKIPVNGDHYTMFNKDYSKKIAENLVNIIN